MDRVIMIEFNEHNYDNYLLISETFEGISIDHKTFIIDPVTNGEEDTFKEVAIVTYSATRSDHESICKKLKTLFENRGIVREMHYV